MIPVVKTYRRSPFYFNNLHNDDYCGGTMENYFNNVNVAENEDSYKVELAAPGFERDEIKVTIDKNQLTIASEVKTAQEDEKENFLRREFTKKSFSRTFELPKNSDLEKIDAAHANGVLSITIAKMAKVEIPVKEIDIK